MQTIYHVTSSEGEFTTNSLKQALKEAKKLLERDMRVVMFTSTVKTDPSPTAQVIERFLEGWNVKGVAN